MTYRCPYDVPGEPIRKHDLAIAASAWCKTCEINARQGTCVHCHEPANWDEPCSRGSTHDLGATPRSAVVAAIAAKSELAPAELEIRAVCSALAEMLVDKNRKYGDSALNPVRIASKSSPIEQILVRIDDKLCRWKNRQSDEDEDIESDLLGYLVLLRIARDRQSRSPGGQLVPGDYGHQ